MSHTCNSRAGAAENGCGWGPVDPHGQPNLLSELLASKRSPLKGKLHEQEGKLWIALEAFKSTHTHLHTCTQSKNHQSIPGHCYRAIKLTFVAVTRRRTEKKSLGECLCFLKIFHLLGRNDGKRSRSRACLQLWLIALNSSEAITLRQAISELSCSVSHCPFVVEQMHTSSFSADNFAFSHVKNISTPSLNRFLRKSLSNIWRHILKICHDSLVHSSWTAGGGMTHCWMNYYGIGNSM